MENHLISSKFENKAKNSRIIRDFCDSSSSCLHPQSPQEANDSQIVGPENSQLKQRKLPSPLTSTEVSLTMSVEDIAQRIAKQLDGESEHNGVFLRLEGQFSGDESGDLNSTFRTKESNRRTRVIKVFKQVLKKCGYIVAATIAVPLIAGKKSYFLIFEFFYRSSLVVMLAALLTSCTTSLENFRLCFQLLKLLTIAFLRGSLVYLFTCLFISIFVSFFKQLSKEQHTRNTPKYFVIPLWRENKFHCIFIPLV